MRILLILICMIWMNSARAVIPSDTLKISEVSVQVNRISHQAKNAVTKFDSFIVANQQHKSLHSFLQENSAIQFKTYGASGTSVISIRGSNASHSKVVWNGMTLGSPMLNMNDFSTIPMVAAEEINIYKGGTSSTQGTGALGGYISLSTNAPYNQELLQFSLISNSMNNHQAGIKYNTGNSKFASSTIVYFADQKNQYKYNNYTETGSPLQNQINSKINYTGIIQSLHYRKNKNDFSYYLWYQENARDLSPPIFNRNKISYQMDNSWRNHFIWKRQINSRQKLEATFSYTRETLRYVSRIQMAGLKLELFNTHSYFDQAQHQNSWIYTSKKWQHKLSYQYNFEGANTSEYKGYRQRNRFSISQLSSYDVSKNWNLESSNRIEFVNKSNIYAGSFSISRSNLFIPELSLSAKLSKNYNLPGLNDLFWVPGGNPNLGEEKSLEKNMNLVYAKNSDKFNTRIAGSIYHSNVDDWILWQPSTLGNGIWTPSNLKEVQLRGFEIEYDFTWKINSISSLNMNGYYTYNAAINKKQLSPLDLTLGNQLIYIPIEKYGLRLKGQRKETHIELRMSRISHRFTTMDNEEFLPSYLLLDFHAGHRFTLKKQIFNVGIFTDNILNQYYESIPYQAMPGRVIGIQLTYQINNLLKK